MTFVRYWPWWVAIGWLIGYEVFAVLTHRPTLSEMVWRAQKRFPMLAIVVLTIIVILILHFWFGLWAPVWATP